MLNPLTEIETPRLVLRVPRAEDAAQIFETYASDAEVTRYLTWRPAENLSQTEEAMGHLIALAESGSAYSLVITRKGDGRVMGMVSARPEGYRVNLGYVLGRAFWGRGYMTEAVAAVVGWALAQPGVYRVWAVCDVDNPASARVMEKVGMQREGVLRRWGLHPNVSDEPRDCICYALVR